MDAEPVSVYKGREDHFFPPPNGGQGALAIVESQLVGANVVVAARQFNPTIFTQLWLVDHGIAAREDFVGGDSFILTPPFVQFRTPAYLLLVMPEQLQFVPLPITEKAAEMVLEKVGAIVRLLPQTPYVAVGLNFHWFLVPGASDYDAFCRALFFRTNPLFASFDTGDARFGGYLSRDVLGTRLKLDIKPVKIGGPMMPTPEILQLVFNYNVDLKGANTVEQIEETLSRWNEARNYASQIISELENWQWR